MPLFERYSGGQRAACVRTYDEAEIAKHRRFIEDGVDNWREVEDPSAQKPLTPKQKLQAEASDLGLSTDGTADEIAARIAGRPLTDDEKILAADAKILANVDAEHDPAEVRAKLAELAAK